MKIYIALSFLFLCQIGFGQENRLLISESFERNNGLGKLMISGRAEYSYENGITHITSLRLDTLTNTYEATAIRQQYFSTMHNKIERSIYNRLNEHHYSEQIYTYQDDGCLERYQWIRSFFEGDTINYRLFKYYGGKCEPDSIYYYELLERPYQKVIVQYEPLSEIKTYYQYDFEDGQYNWKYGWTVLKEISADGKRITYWNNKIEYGYVERFSIHEYDDRGDLVYREYQIKKYNEDDFQLDQQDYYLKKYDVNDLLLEEKYRTANYIDGNFSGLSDWNSTVYDYYCDGLLRSKKRISRGEVYEQENYYYEKSIDCEDQKEPIQIHVYPNPTTDQININSEALLYNTDLKLYDLTGRLLYQKDSPERIDQHTISLVDFPAGIYLLQIYIGDLQKTVKVMKE